MQWRAPHQHRARLWPNKHHPTETARQQETQLSLREGADKGGKRDLADPQARGFPRTRRVACEGDERGADAEPDEEPIRTKLHQQTQDEEDLEQREEETQAEDAESKCAHLAGVGTCALRHLWLARQRSIWPGEDGHGQTHQLKDSHKDIREEEGRRCQQD